MYRQWKGTLILNSNPKNVAGTKEYHDGQQVNKLAHKKLADKLC